MITALRGLEDNFVRERADLPLQNVMRGTRNGVGVERKRFSAEIQTVVTTFPAEQRN